MSEKNDQLALDFEFYAVVSKPAQSELEIVPGYTKTLSHKSKTIVWEAFFLITSIEPDLAFQVCIPQGS